MEVLTDLHRIKVFREQRAERELMKARLILRDADEALKHEKISLKNFIEESIRREKSMYRDLCSRLVFLKEIENVRIDVDLMKEKSEKLQKRVEVAKAARLEAAEREEASRQAYMLATRTREKFDELKNILLEENKQRIANIEELDVEELANSRFILRTVPDLE